MGPKSLYEVKGFASILTHGRERTKVPGLVPTLTEHPLHFWIGQVHTSATNTMSSLQEFVNADADAERRAQCSQEFGYGPEAASETIREHDQGSQESPQTPEMQGAVASSTTTATASRTTVGAGSSTSTIHDKDRRMGVTKAPMVRHRCLKARVSDPGTGGGTAKNLGAEFDSAMDDDSQELMNDQEMQQRMVAHGALASQCMASEGAMDPAQAAGRHEERPAPSPPPPKATEADDFWSTMRSLMKQENSELRTELRGDMECRINALDKKIDAGRAEEAGLREALAERIDATTTKVTELAERMERLELQGAGTGGAPASATTAPSTAAGETRQGLP